MQARAAAGANHLQHLHHTDLTALWDIVRGYGEAVHAPRGAKPDGLAAWQPMKAALAAAEGVGEWTATRTGDVATDAEVLAAFEAHEAGGSAGVDTEDAHYYAQLLRVPAREECSVRRVLQVAYNAGQLRGSGALERLARADPRWRDLHAAHNLDALTTYCTDASQFRVPPTFVEDVRAVAAKLA